MGTWKPARDQESGEGEENEIENSQRDQMQYQAMELSGEFGNCSESDEAFIIGRFGASWEMI